MAKCNQLTPLPFQWLNKHRQATSHNGAPLVLRLNSHHTSVCRFLMAHQHIKGYSVPCNG